MIKRERKNSEKVGVCQRWRGRGGLSLRSRYALVVLVYNLLSIPKPIPSPTSPRNIHFFIIEIFKSAQNAYPLDCQCRPDCEYTPCCPVHVQCAVQADELTFAQLLLKILETQDLAVDYTKVAAAWRKCHHSSWNFLHLTKT
jgi:hypothetical protein